MVAKVRNGCKNEHRVSIAGSYLSGRQGPHTLEETMEGRREKILEDKVMSKRM